MEGAQNEPVECYSHSTDPLEVRYESLEARSPDEGFAGVGTVHHREKSLAEAGGMLGSLRTGAEPKWASGRWIQRSLSEVTGLW